MKHKKSLSKVSGFSEQDQTDLDIAISNESGRLVANAIIYYNSAILSFLLDKHQASGNKKALKLIQMISPVAWQHIHFLGHYNFSSKRAIDLNELIAHLVLTEEV